MSDRIMTISVDEELYNLIKKRAKKQYMSITDLLFDIVRRSMISYKKNSIPNDKTDDQLVSLFSRANKGRKSRQ